MSPGPQLRHRGMATSSSSSGRCDRCNDRDCGQNSSGVDMIFDTPREDETVPRSDLSTVLIEEAERRQLQGRSIFSSYFDTTL